MSEHTPGPWKWHWRRDDDDAPASVYAEPREGHAYAVAMMPRYQKREQWTADAALIAAAPDMMEALRRCRAELASLRDGSTGGIPNAICALIPEAIDGSENLHTSPATIPPTLSGWL